jgi:hypothetical protein
MLLAGNAFNWTSSPQAKQRVEEQTFYRKHFPGPKQKTNPIHRSCTALFGQKSSWTVEMDFSHSDDLVN